MSTRERRDRVLALTEAQRRTRNLFVFARSAGDWRTVREARRDLASIRRAEAVLRRRGVHGNALGAS